MNGNRTTPPVPSGDDPYRLRRPRDLKVTQGSESAETTSAFRMSMRQVLRIRRSQNRSAPVREEFQGPSAQAKREMEGIGKWNADEGRQQLAEIEARARGLSR